MTGFSDNTEKKMNGSGEGAPTARVVTSKDRMDELASYEIPPEETKALLHTLDMRIAPLVMILYLIAFLDRSNIGMLHPYRLKLTIRQRSGGRHDDRASFPRKRSFGLHIHLLRYLCRL